MAKRKAARTDGDYVILRGISWPDGSAEVAEVRSDLPPEYVADWIDCGAIEPADASEE